MVAVSCNYALSWHPPTLQGSLVNRWCLCFCYVPLQVLRSTAAVFTNGFVFDELPLELVKQAIRTASDAGAAVLFDPGKQALQRLIVE
jgi:hypothetical protein